MALYNFVYMIPAQDFIPITSHTSANLFWLLYQINIFDPVQKLVP